MEAPCHAIALEPVATIDRRRQELLQILRAAGKQPLTYRDLAAFGIRQSANLIYEVELIGQAAERVYRRVWNQSARRLPSEGRGADRAQPGAPKPLGGHPESLGAYDL